MAEKDQPTHWTKDRCAEEALKYKTRWAFSQSASSAYQTARIKGWLDDVCSHMITIRKPNGYWSKQRIHEEALKYKTRGDFQRHAQTAYVIAQRDHYLDEVCSHMKRVRGGEKPGRKTHHSSSWSKKQIQEIAVLFSTRKEFYRTSPQAYTAAKNKKWLDEVCAHMQSVQTDLYRSTSYWTEARLKHEAIKYCCRRDFKRGSLQAYKIAQRNKLLSQICSHMTPATTPSSYWTREMCLDEALKYQSRSAFQKGSSGAYKAAQKNDWLDQICEHMEVKTWDRKEGFVYLYPLNAKAHLFKVGICNAANLEKRTREVAAQFEGSLSVVFAIRSNNASQVETVLKSYGTKVKRLDLDSMAIKRNGSRKLLSGKRIAQIDGITEMRWILPDQFEEMLEIMRSYSPDGRVTLLKKTACGELQSTVIF